VFGTKRDNVHNFGGAGANTYRQTRDRGLTGFHRQVKVCYISHWLVRAARLQMIKYCVAAASPRTGWFPSRLLRTLVQLQVEEGGASDKKVSVLETSMHAVIAHGREQ
jgi:hypothetical protein